jgi:hypothetical protein
VTIAYIILGLGAASGLLALWVSPRWSLFGVFATLLFGSGTALFALLGGFSTQASVSLLDLAKLAAAPAAFILIAPLLTFVRSTQIRARDRREAENQDEELARFRG